MYECSFPVLTLATWTLIKRMRLPLVSATLAVSFVILLNLFVSNPTPRDKRDINDNSSFEQQFEPKIGQQIDNGVRIGQEKSNGDLLMLFSQELWDNVNNDDDWDAVSGSVCCLVSSLIKIRR